MNELCNMYIGERGAGKKQALKKVMVIGTKQNDICLAVAHDIKKLLALKFEPMETHLAELDPHGLVILQDRYGMSAGKKPNNNLYPFFFVGTCVVVDKDYNGMTDDQITFMNEWLHGLKNC